MEYVRALAVHFAALLLFFMGVMGLISATFGNVSLETGMTILTIEPEHKSRRLNALLGCLCLFAGGGLFLLAVREFRPPSYPLLLLGSAGGVGLVALAFKLMFRSAESMGSAWAKGTLLLVNGLVLALLLTASGYLAAYLWRAVAAA